MRERRKCPQVIYDKSSLFKSDKPRNMRKPYTWRTWRHDKLGCPIYFTNWDERRISGRVLNYHLHGMEVVEERPWVPHRVYVGDYLETVMASGKVARFVIVEVDYLESAPDMFRGVVEDVGYVAE